MQTKSLIMPNGEQTPGIKLRDLSRVSDSIVNAAHFPEEWVSKNGENRASRKGWGQFKGCTFE